MLELQPDPGIPGIFSGPGICPGPDIIFQMGRVRLFFSDQAGSGYCFKKVASALAGYFFRRSEIVLYRLIP